MIKIAYPETTDLKPPSQSVKTKGAPKKVKHTLSDNSTVQTPSYFEHVHIFSRLPNSKIYKKKFLKELALADYLFHRLHPKFHSFTRCQVLCTNILNESSMLRVTVIAVFELFLLYSVKEKIIAHLSAINLSTS